MCTIEQKWPEYKKMHLDYQTHKRMDTQENEFFLYQENSAGTTEMDLPNNKGH